jgi:hypothetical protein
MATKKTIGQAQVEEVAKAPFRLFGKIEHNWVEVPSQFGDARFFMRSMTNSEKSILAKSEDIIAGVRDVSGAFARAGTTHSEVFDGVGDDNRSESDLLKFLELWGKVKAQFIYDEKAESRFIESKKKAVLSCVSMVDVDGIEIPFTADLYDSISSVEVADWLFEEVKRQSYANNAERLSL